MIVGRPDASRAAAAAGRATASTSGGAGPSGETV